VNLVVDTSVWSLVLRRAQVDEADPHVRAFRYHIEAGDGVFLVGNILQELLDGLRDRRHVDRLARTLATFPLVPLHRATHVAAAELRHRCRAHGIQVGPIACLIAAACIAHGFPLLTADRDFSRVARHTDLVVLAS
jgi:hypothetical protein